MSRANAIRYLELYEHILNCGVERSPRGQRCMDLYNGQLQLSTFSSPCTSFEARKFSLLYAKKELQWYIEADPEASWIEQHATAWKKLKQPSGVFYSNYGQYLFNRKLSNHDHTQFEYVVNELLHDPDSRRAVMVLLQPYHLFPENIDTVCTYAMHFSIYEGVLYMTVMMRSNDAVWGLSNDAFCFWCIYQMVYALLQEQMPTLKRGTYVHLANSMHIYERHYQMVRDITTQGLRNFKHIHVPFVTANGVRQLLDMEGPADDDEFTEWLKTE